MAPGSPLTGPHDAKDGDLGGAWLASRSALRLFPTPGKHTLGMSSLQKKTV